MKLEHSCRSIALAGHRGDKQAVIDALGSENPALRATALSAAHRQNLFDAEMLETALADPDADVRRRAIELVARPGTVGISPARAAERLITMLGDEACSEVAAFALGELANAEDDVIGALAEQAGNADDPLAREAAVAALGALGRGRATVLAAMDDVATVRRRAVIALAAFDGDDVDAALVGALADRDWQVRQAAEDLLDDGDPATDDQVG